MYVAHQQTVPVNRGVIRLARMPRSGDHFELVTVEGEDSIGDGWLPAIDCVGSRVAAAWEHSEVDYFQKGTHRIAVAHVDFENLDSPAFSLTDLTSSDPEDPTEYDVAAAIQLEADGKRAHLTYVHVQTTDAGAGLQLRYRSDDFGLPGCDAAGSE